MKKQTAANNEFLREVKALYNTAIFKKLSKIVNEQGTEAAKKELAEIKKYI